MQNKEFKHDYNEKYKELLFAELIISFMEKDKTSVRSLAKEVSKKCSDG